MSAPGSNEHKAMTVEALRATLKRQYHASLAMLRQAIELCPEDMWADSQHVNDPWQVAYHTVFFAHLYMQRTVAAFQPWEHHQKDVQYPDCIPGPPKPESPLPLLPTPYTKDQVLAYLDSCDEMVDKVVDTLDLLAADSGFWWYKVPKLEHQIINIRHIQHGAAQIADRVRSRADLGVDWVGTQSGRKSTMEE